MTLKFLFYQHEDVVDVIFYFLKKPSLKEAKITPRVF